MPIKAEFINNRLRKKTKFFLNLFANELRMRLDFYPTNTIDINSNKQQTAMLSSFLMILSHLTVRAVVRFKLTEPYCIGAAGLWVRRNTEKTQDM